MAIAVAVTMVIRRLARGREATTSNAWENVMISFRYRARSHEVEPCACGGRILMITKRCCSFTSGVWHGNAGALLVVHRAVR